MKRHLRRRGGALVIALLTLMIIVLLSGALLRSLLAASRQSRRSETELQAQWLAEAAISRGLARLAADSAYEGETWRIALGQSVDQSGVATIRVESIPEQSAAKRIRVTAQHPEDPVRRIRVEREHVLRPQNDAPTTTNQENSP
jgi:Tfp pilus assembly protein PilX